MASRTLAQHGRYSVIENAIGDGSAVYDIEFLSDSGEMIRVSCPDSGSASMVATTLAARALAITVLGTRVPA